MIYKYGLSLFKQFYQDSRSGVAIRKIGAVAILMMAVLLMLNHYFDVVALNTVVIVLSVIIPGILLVYLLKINSTKLVKSFLTVPLGFLYCMCIGLLANFVGPIVHLNLLSSPLISVCLILGCMPLVYFNTDSYFRFTVPKLEPGDYFNILLGLITVATSIVGAIVLNNGGSAWIAFCVYVLLLFSVFLVARRFYEKSATGIILIILQGVAVVLAYSIRNAHISGSDINTELHIARITQMSGHWSLRSFPNIYNACLSISILPVVLSNISRLGLETIFKIFLPIAYVAILIVVYSLSKKFDRSERSSLLAVIFFMVQPAFIDYPLIPIRQEVSFLFFGGTIMALLLDNDILTKRLLFVLMGAGMALSHYSTAYIAIALYAVTVILRTWIFPLISHIRGIKTNIDIGKVTLSGKMVFVLFLFVFLWYGQVGVGFNGFTSFIKTSFKDVPSILSPNSQANNQSAVSQFGLSNNDLEEQTISRFIEETHTFTVHILSPSSIFTPQNKQNLTLKIFQLRNVVELVSKIVIICGSLVFIYKMLKRKVIKLTDLLTISSLSLLAVLILAPTLSQSYGFDRVYQQLLIVIAPIGVYLMLAFRKQTRNFYIIGSSFIAIYFILMSYMTGIWTGDSSTPLTLSNHSLAYANYASTSADVLGADWLINNRDNSKIYADNYAFLRLQIANNLSQNVTFKTNFYDLPLNNKSYIYSDTTNNILGLAESTYNETPVYFQFPTAYLSDTKNIIYTNGDVKVYK